MELPLILSVYREEASVPPETCSGGRGRILEKETLKHRVHSMEQRRLGKRLTEGMECQAGAQGGGRVES